MASRPRSRSRELRPEHLEIILYGTKGERVRVRHNNRNGRDRTSTPLDYEGVVPNLERRYRETESDYIRGEIERYMASRPCPACKGARLKPEVHGGHSRGALNRRRDQALGLEGARVLPLPGGRGSRRSADLRSSRRPTRRRMPRLSERDMLIARGILKEVKARLGFLVDVGLDYLTLDRTAATLSGGEAQRIRLATQIGSGLVGVLYILDEPSIGLHQRDNARLIQTLDAAQRPR